MLTGGLSGSQRQAGVHGEVAVGAADVGVRLRREVADAPEGRCILARWEPLRKNQSVTEQWRSVDIL